MGETLELLVAILTGTGSILRRRLHLESLKKVTQMNPRKVNR